MSEPMSPDRKRLLYRAMHRGFKEADLIIGRFAEDHLASMSEDEVTSFEALLEIPDQELYGWIIGRTEVPDEFNTPMLRRLQAYDVASTMGR